MTHALLLCCSAVAHLQDTQFILRFKCNELNPRGPGKTVFQSRIVRERTAVLDASGSATRWAKASGGAGMPLPWPIAENPEPRTGSSQAGVEGAGRPSPR